MKNTMTETRFIIYVLLAIMSLMSIHIFHPQLAQAYNPTNYVSLHAMLEFFGISISTAIVLYSWKTVEASRSRIALLLIFIFLTVGMIDLLHTLTFKGMPFFLGESSVAKATWFWVIGRAIEAIMMITFMLLPDKRLERDWRGAVLAASFLVIASVMAIVFIFEKSLPLLFIEGQGTTPLKNGLEYFISFLHFISLVICLYRYYVEKSSGYLYMGMAFTFLFLSEMIFTVYQSVLDLDNFSGHIFKAIGYYFILKGFFYVHFPEAQRKAEGEVTVENIVKEIPCLIFSFAKREDGRLAISYIGGSLAKRMKRYAVGTLVEEWLPASAGSAMDRCIACWEYAEKQTFTAHLNGRDFVFSLSPVMKDGIIVKVAGIAAEMTEMAAAAPPPADLQKQDEIKVMQTM